MAWLHFKEKQLTIIYNSNENLTEWENKNGLIFTWNKIYGIADMQTNFNKKCTV